MNILFSVGLLTCKMLPVVRDENKWNVKLTKYASTIEGYCFITCDLNTSTYAYFVKRSIAK